MKNRHRETPVYKIILGDILLAGIILLVFAFFHHVLPAMRNGTQLSTKKPQIQTSVPETVATPAPTPAPTPVPTAEPTPDMRTPWQIAFEDHFTDSVVKTANSYSSPNVSVKIDTISTGEGSDKITYHVADIYIASIDCFKTYLANGEYAYFATQDVEDLDASANAILSISGDFATYQQTGFLVRNGEICRNDAAWCDIAVLYEDGTMECLKRGTYTNDGVLAKGALQVWNFGPSLLDENGNTFPYYDASQTVLYPNPRSAVGYYEPGHYCFVVADGRQEGYSKGMLLGELASVFQELGCACAYNLDGGGSAVMLFDHERYSVQSNGADRQLGDILYICEG